MNIINYKTNIKFDQSKPNGTHRKTLDVSLAKLYGWKSKTNLTLGLKNTYLDYLKN